MEARGSHDNLYPNQKMVGIEHAGILWSHNCVALLNLTICSELFTFCMDPSSLFSWIYAQYPSDTFSSLCQIYCPNHSSCLYVMNSFSCQWIGYFFTAVLYSIMYNKPDQSPHCFYVFLNNMYLFLCIYMFACVNVCVPCAFRSLLKSEEVSIN